MWSHQVYGQHSPGVEQGDPGDGIEPGQSGPPSHLTNPEDDELPEEDELSDVLPEVAPPADDEPVETSCPHPAPPTTMAHRRGSTNRAENAKAFFLTTFMVK
jgi:hypothetical protein